MTEPPVTPSMAAFGSHDNCPNCGARMAADQRYCLNCGHRRGEPRLPFMDAVVFMESMNAPGGGGGTPPPPPTTSGGDSSGRWNANAALIAGVATLVLAIGVGFLIGRSGNDNSSPSSAAPQVIKVEGGTGGGGGEVEETAPEEATGSSSAESGGDKGSSESGGSGGKQKNTSEIEEGSKEEKELAQKKTEETLHAEGPLPETGTQVGESCKAGTPGCEGGEFTGNFFGE